MNRMHHWQGIWMMAAIMLALAASPAAGADAFPATWWKAGFETPVAFSAPQEIGMDAVALVSPKGKKPGQGELEIVLAAVPKEMGESFGNDDAEILNYVKTTFMGLSKPAEKKVERSFLGKKTVGEAHLTNIPKKTHWEIYLVPLSGGDRLVMGFGRDGALPADQAAAVIDMAAKTLKEVKAK